MGKVLVFLVFLTFFTSVAEGWDKRPCHNLNLAVTGDMMSASSQRDASHSAAQGLLHNQRSWSARHNDKTPWLAVKFSELTMVTGIRTKGNPLADEWVRFFEIWYSIDGVEFTPYKKMDKSGPKLFPGNSNRNGVVRYILDRPYIVAIAVQIRPKSWVGRHASMRIQLTGCPQSNNVHVVCTSKGMTILIHTDVLRGFKASELQLNNPSCKAQRVRLGNTTYFRLSTNLDGCNTTCSTTKTFITYYNRVTEKSILPGQVISRLPLVSIPFTCTYRILKVKTGPAIKPNVSVLFLFAHNFGKFPCLLEMYKTSRYLLKVTGGPVHVQLSHRLFMQISFLTGDSHLWIRASRCYGSPSKNPSSMPQWNLITDGCTDDKTVIMYKRRSPKIQRFSFLSFVLLKHFKYVFIHCVAKVCKGNKKNFCGKTCPKNGKRGLSDVSTAGPERLITHGPFVVHGDPTPKDIKREWSLPSSRGIPLKQDMIGQEGETLLPKEYFWDGKAQDHAKRIDKIHTEESHGEDKGEHLDEQYDDQQPQGEQWSLSEEDLRKLEQESEQQTEKFDTEETQDNVEETGGKLENVPDEII